MAKLIRRDDEWVDAERLALLRAELKSAFAASDFAYQPLDGNALIARNARG